MAKDLSSLLEFIEKMEHLTGFQDKIDNPSSISQIWKVFLDDIRNLINIEACALFMVNEQTHEFMLKHVIPENKKNDFNKELNIQIESGMFSSLINRRQPALLPSFVHENQSTMIMLPLTTSRNTQGVALVLTPIEESSITQENMKLLSALSKQCALVMENTRLYNGLKKEHAYLEKAHEEIRVLSITDVLTGCYNRLYLTEHLPKELKRAKRYGHPLSIVLCDLDHFKSINDTYGHLAGDAVLKQFVQAGIEVIRTDVDWLARYGGEEFLIVLPESDVTGACYQAERMRKKISEMILNIHNFEIKITCSFGVTGIDFTTDRRSITAEDLVSRADGFLYKVKNGGRNGVIGAPF